MSSEASDHRSGSEVPEGTQEPSSTRRSQSVTLLLLLSSGEAGPVQLFYGRRLSRKKNVTNLIALPCGHCCPPSPASG